MSGARFTARGLTRLTAAALAAVAGIGLWQALRLERWGFDGPDAGFFPQLTAVAALLLALAVAVWPGQASPGDDEEGGEGDEGSIGAPVTFAWYAVALVVMAAGSFWVGFVPTAVLLSVLVMRFGEGRSWLASVGFGLVCGLFCLAVFGWLLRVDLPEGPVERLFFSMVR
jgi:hypothetical protein